MFQMSNYCGVCGIEEKYDEYHRMYRRCDLCYTKHALECYYNSKDKKIENNKSYYHNKREFFSKQNKKPTGKKMILKVKLTR